MKDSGSAGISTRRIGFGRNLKSRMRQKLIGYLESGPDTDSTANLQALKPPPFRRKRRTQDAGGSFRFDYMSEDGITRARVKGTREFAEYLVDEIQVFLEHGMVDIHDAWRIYISKALGNNQDIPQPPGYLYPPIGLVRLLEDNLGPVADEGVFYRLAESIWVDYTSLGLEVFLTKGQPDSAAEQEAIQDFEDEQSLDLNTEQRPIGTATRAYIEGEESLSHAEPNLGARLLANRRIDETNWFMQAAGVGKFRSMTEARLGTIGDWPWLLYCRPSALGATWGLYTYVRYPNEATEEFPAALRYFLVRMSNIEGVKFWELPISSDVGTIVQEYLDLGREDYDSEDFSTRYKRHRIEAHILATLEPIEFYDTATQDPPDFQVGAADLGMDLMQGTPIYYGFHISPMGERFGVVTRYPIYRESGSTHETPGINRWYHELFRGTIEINEDKLINDDEIEFEVTWTIDEELDFTPQRRDWLYVPSTKYPNTHLLLRWDTKGKEDDYAGTGPGEQGIYPSDGCPIYMYYAREAGGLEVICRQKLDVDTTATEPAPPYFNFPNNWYRQAVRHPTPIDGTAVSNEAHYYQGIGLLHHGFFIEREQTAGEQDHEIIADYRWNYQLDTSNNGRNRVSRYAKVFMTEIVSDDLVDATDNGNWWSAWGDYDNVVDHPGFDPCDPDDLIFRGWQAVPNEAPWQLGNPNFAPTLMQNTFGFVGSYRIGLRTGETSNSILICPSYCSEGLLLSIAINFTDEVVRWDLSERLSSIQYIDNYTGQEGAPFYYKPSYKEAHFAADGDLLKWSNGGGINRNTNYIAIGALVYRYVAYMDLHTTTIASPIRVAKRQFGIAPAGTREDTPGITRILEPGESATNAILEEEGRWRLLYDPGNRGVDGQYYLEVDLEARMGTGGYGWFRADFASSDQNERQATRGGMPAPWPGDVLMLPGLHDSKDTDPPETDLEEPELPIEPPEAFEAVWDTLGPDSTGSGIGCT